jgi:quercetin dioxygenase-like cupin family protein
MNRTVRAIVLGMIAVLATVGVAAATTPSGATPTTLGRGTLAAGAKINTENLKLQVRTDVDVVTQSITIVPNGHFGWHSHPGPVIVTVTAGALTFYDGDDATCSPVVFAAGSSFIDEGGGHVHFARNEGPTNLVLYATYLVPVGAPLRIDMPDPGLCAF